MKNLKFLLIALLIFGLWNCQQKNKLEVDVSGIPAQVKIDRFDKAFFGQPVRKLPELKKKYPYILPPNSPDSIWIKKMNDTLFLKLKKQVDSLFPDLKKYKPAIADLYKHIKYYHPDFRDPKIITLYSDWNFLNRAFYADSLMFLTLDTYLGKDNPVYTGGVPMYIRQNLIPERIPVELARAVAQSKVKPPENKAFLYRMINEGKKMYLIDAYVPDLPDTLKIGYTAEKYKWAQENEAKVWEYFVTKKLLYSSANGLENRFLNIAPYSKFYSEIDMETPGQIGVYTGWQIVRSFMQNNDVSLQKMIRMPEEEIFKKSKYKPRR